jgi:hypothetical protein
MNPWVSVWLSPRATIRQVVAENPNRSLWWLASVYGFSSLLNGFQSLMLGFTMPLVALLLLAAVLSPIWGYLFFTIWGGIVSFTGKWLKGAGTFKEVRAAYSWSCVPLIANIPLWIMLSFFFGQALFANFAQTQILTQGQVSFLFLVLIIRIGAAIWSLILYINMLAEVQAFSVLRAIGNILISGLILAGASFLFFYALAFLFQATPDQTKTVFQLFQDNSLRYL